ncbi:inosine/xanthosine triphosphatase [Halorubrum sp. BV1]|uniref:inosine/xanthosine triphosphatase n=1 Tax=Halorubrum sp. BV1 TaxID=1498500 RepID=UPI000679132C|nr:inosine/xanthosine triphosphatase [Halorubrum sp. BV1]
MTAYQVGVGSGNPVKRRAVEQVLDADAIESVPVPSGVSEQPVGHAETIAGAENRAAAVLGEGAYDIGVGIEGGVAQIDGADGLFLVMWAVIDDGERVGRGAGPSLALPDRIATRIQAGEELGPVMDDVLDTDGVARRGGAAGALTDGRVDRADALATAVAGALGPFVSKLY